MRVCHPFSFVLLFAHAACSSSSGAGDLATIPPDPLPGGWSTPPPESNEPDAASPLPEAKEDAGAPDASSSAAIVAGKLDPAFGGGAPVFVTDPSLLTLDYSDFHLVGSKVVYTRTTTPVMTDVLLRLTEAGKRDATFGTNGMLKTEAGIRRSVRLSNGKIVVTTMKNGMAEIARLDASYARDTSMAPIPAGTYANAVLKLGPSDVVGYTMDDGFGILRPDGTRTFFPAPTYFPGDVVAPGGDRVVAIVDGKVKARRADATVDTLLEGLDAARLAADASHVVVLRYDYDAGITYKGAIEAKRFDATSIDASFGNAGTASIPFGKGPHDVRLSAAVIQSDGRIVLGFASESADDITFVRLTTTGALDPTFGTAGVATFAGIGSLYRMALDDKERLVFSLVKGNPMEVAFARVLL